MVDKVFNTSVTYVDPGFLESFTFNLIKGDLDAYHKLENAIVSDEYARKFWQNRKRSGVTLYGAQKFMRERNYFGAMMVTQGDADSMITGYARSYPSVIRPVLEAIGKFEGVSKVATTNLMLTKRGPLFISD